MTFSLSQLTILRNVLFVGILAVGFLLITRWAGFKEQQQITENPVDEITLSSQQSSRAPLTQETTDTLISSGDTTTSNTAANDVVVPNDSSAPARAPENFASNTTGLIKVDTNRLSILIDPVGGDIVKAALKKHLRKIDTPNEPYVLLNRTSGKLYIAQSGLMGVDGIDDKGARPVYQTEKTTYSLGDEDSLSVTLRHQASGVTYLKTFSFDRDSYLIDVNYTIENASASAWQGKLFGTIRRDDSKPIAESTVGMSPYLGAAITTEDKNYREVSFKDMRKEAFREKRQGGWVAMVQHYFISAWIPDADLINQYDLRSLKNGDEFLLGFVSEEKIIPAGSSGNFSADFYAGPKDINKLEKMSPYLDLTIDYSFLWFIAKPLFKALDFIHGYVGNWGFAIIILTFFIKLLFLYPSAMSYRSMAKMRKLQPKLARLKEQHGDDRQRMSQELMKMYKDEKVNPLGGCLPVLLQMPVFLSLYWVILESVELRHSPFILWIEDLSVRDPYFVLPLLMGFTMFIQQKLNPTPPDPMQAKVMKMLPIIFTALFILFPAGLVLYWVVNNTLSIIQQYIITRQIEKAD